MSSTILKKNSSTKEIAIKFASLIHRWSSTHHDAASRFVRMTTRGIRDHIIPEDLIPLVQDVVETHPGLTFLKEATEFHSRYVHTVINALLLYSLSAVFYTFFFVHQVVARIFYSVNRSWSGKISVAELRRSNLLAVISVLEHEEDINQVTAYFSYEHFYVIYCKFWELDRDHDLFIDKLDLTRHNDNGEFKLEPFYTTKENSFVRQCMRSSKYRIYTQP